MDNLWERLRPLLPPDGRNGIPGSRAARSFLWRECGLSGTPEAAAFRETVCALIRYFATPYDLPQAEERGRILRSAAAVGEKAPAFTWRLLCGLAEADAENRDDAEERIRKVREAARAAEEAGCLDGPYPFPDAYSARAWFSGRSKEPDLKVPDDSWGEVILLSGLPGTGKDRWIRENQPEKPMISLDGIRLETGIRPTEPQEEVLRIARERAVNLLQDQQPFVWNATNLTPEIRRGRIELFEQYGARVRIVWLETGWSTRICRNRGRTRDAVVPEEKVLAMLETMTPPMPDEAWKVDWICV